MSKVIPSIEDYHHPIDLVLYHGNCFDGFGSAFVAWKYLGYSAEYIACIHGEEPPVCTGSSSLGTH